MGELSKSAFAAMVLTCIACGGCKSARDSSPAPATPTAPPSSVASVASVASGASGASGAASSGVVVDANGKLAFNRFPVKFTSGSRTLTGFFWLPLGAGPHRAVVFNHGSERDPGDSYKLAEFYNAHGFAFFVPVRRGHGKSDGKYIGDLQDEASSDTREKVAVDELAAQTDDVIAAYAYLASRADVRKDAVALTGCSYGGIEVVLTAARESGYKVAIDFAGGAMAWSSNATLRARMTDAVAHATIPIFFVQAENDFNTAPSTLLSAEMDRVHKPNQRKIYPPRGTSAREGHGLCREADAWGDDALAWINRAMP